jgi:hypothetical protein
MDGIALKPLTVSFSEPGFVAKLNSENQFGPWFTLSDTEQQQLGSPMGPQNPQALNRYSYVLNNPMRWTDPTGHAPPSPCMANQSCWYNKVYDGIQQAVGEVAADILNFGIGLGQTIMFRGGAARSFDWDHIMNNHSEGGKVANERLKGTNGQYDGIFRNMNEGQIKGAVKEAWANREKVQTQSDPVSGVVRELYRGTDTKSNLTIEMWYNTTTKVVETAYPIFR